MTDALWTPLWLTARVATAATLVNLILAVPIAHLLGRRFVGRDLIEALLLQPLVLPPTVLGYYLLVAFGRSSALGRWLTDTVGLQLIFTPTGAVIAAVVSSFPLLYRPLRAALSAVDAELRDAARLDCQTSWQRLRFIDLPLASGGLLAGAGLAFARAAGDFGATLMVAGNLPGRTQTLSLAIYDAVQLGRFDDANRSVALMTAFACLALYFSNRFGGRSG